MPVALITGASRGLGRALSRELSDRGWHLIIDARNGAALDAAAQELAPERVTAVVGDVGDPSHRHALMEAVRRIGTLDVLVNNASTLGPSPLPPLGAYPLRELEQVIKTNVIAPLALMQSLLSHLEASGGTIVNVTSDAAVEPYAGWGGYGASKAALDQLSAVLGVEYTAVHVYAFDPGDMRTEMHQQAFPGEDISDRPEPAVVVPSLLRLLDEHPPSGRYRAADLETSPQSAGR
ncbi:MAG: SDR family oxidoreductase [Actinomycetota bacterium]|nr:SDR family oxidoreductase [Actinomycetota bacterium]